MNNLSSFKELNGIIRQMDPRARILVTSHIFPDGDALSSTLAVNHLLKRAFNRESVMCNHSELPLRFTFLEGLNHIVQPHQISGKFDVVFAVDCGDIGRLGDSINLLSNQTIIINIDHHSTNNSFGYFNIIKPNAAATAQMLFEWINDLVADKYMKWTPPLASMIYTGLITDTGGFRYSNTTSQSLVQAAQLLELGIDAGKIAELSMERMSLSQLLVLRSALNTIQQTPDGKITWCSLSLKDWQEAKAQSGDEEGISSYARNIDGTEVGLFFWERPQGIKISFRTFGDIDVAQLAKMFGGGGHSKAAGAFVKGELQDVEYRVITKLRELIG